MSVQCVPRFQLRAVVGDVHIGQPIAFPNTFLWDQPKGADVFVLDPPNELSTRSSDSSGSITFQELSCSPGGEVRFTVDAVIGSELGDAPSMAMRGGFRSRIGDAPAF
jgi:hypothetical protein